MNPEEGLKIFTEDIQEVEHLPRPKVLDYLLRTHKSLVIPYLVSNYTTAHAWNSYVVDQNTGTGFITNDFF